MLLVADANIFFSAVIARGFTLDLLFSDGLQIEEAASFREYMSEADSISPDPDDVQYFALALKLGCPIWSNDPHFREQSDARVLIKP